MTVSFIPLHLFMYENRYIICAEETVPEESS